MEKIDIKYLGIPNVCFSLTSPEDLREEKFKLQRQERGFDSSEAWSLYETIAKFILPRLIMFRDTTVGTPMEFSERDDWQSKLDKMIIAFDLIANKDIILLSKKENKLIDKGLKLFHKYYFKLWY